MSMMNMASDQERQQSRTMVEPAKTLPPSSPPSTTTTTTTTQVYKRRYVMLTLLFMSSVLMGFHYMSFSSLTQQLTTYYNVKPVAVTSLGTMYYVAYFILFYFSNGFIHKHGLKISLITAGFLNSFGAALKCFTVIPQLFYFAYLGQIFASIGQVLIINMSTLLPAVWFEAREVASATAFAISGAFIGNAISFLFTFTLFGEDSDTKQSLSVLTVSFALISTLIFFAILLLSKERPDTPPSGAQLLKSKGSEHVSWTDLIKNRDFVLITIATSVCWSINTTLTLTLNQALLNMYTNNFKLVSSVGILMSIASVLGSLLWGKVLDQYKRYKMSAIFSYSCTTLSLLVLSFALWSTWSPLIYLSAFFFGFNAVGFYSMSFDMVAEFTYPAFETYPLGIFYCTVSLVTITVATSGPYFIEILGTLNTMVLLSLLLCLGLLLLFCFQWNLRRQMAEANASTYQRFEDDLELKEELPNLKKLNAEDILTQVSAPCYSALNTNNKLLT